MLFPGGYFQKCWLGVCGPLPKTLAFYALAKFKIRYTTYDRCSWHICPKHKLRRTLVDGLIDNDEKVSSSFQETDPIQD